MNRIWYGVWSILTLWFGFVAFKLYMQGMYVETGLMVLMIWLALWRTLVHKDRLSG